MIICRFSLILIIYRYTFIFSPLISNVLIKKSTPIVAACPVGNIPWQKRRTKHVLPLYLENRIL